MKPSSDNPVISIHLYQEPSRGKDTWAYSVNIAKGVHKIGYGHDLNSAISLARRGVKSAEKYLKTAKQSILFGCSNCCKTFPVEITGDVIKCPECGKSNE